MKVVLFCGGLGTRLREYSETIPKPMVEIGYRPIIWNLMRYYAHFGHKEFILCLGYKGDYIKNYFLNYNECLSNNFTLSNGGKNVQLHTTDIEDWKITFVDTGLNLNIGERLVAVKPYLEGDEYFLANYADGLSDLDLNLYLEHFHQQDKIASFLAVQPSHSFHVVSLHNEDGIVESIQSVGHSDLWINGGFFVLRKDIFDYISPGEELVLEPFQRLIQQQQLIAYKNPGFWACMDTLKEKMLFDDMYAKGNTPWALWESSPEILGNSGKAEVKNLPNPQAAQNTLASSAI
ncbi:glucose-1-phosphate cytidylyltransferase [Leptolyngbya cf. ectocarpi LEGE 11479]|uniref:Glucose-1-phosphate cytidylyltransferase n=1 Tax=Leptolyngbya cf. ectocarpi LEGE 11479 TaxID=1828722 RepID=A0A928ZWU2_LEPEC|nr:sugar phosphate nucleotidyltransferase [Leptolyngbya ectocarpi]MBE9068944.1 glucose-1-phosphate cytidylyltransferase [Leptolyngbya cf. ectocarpi LEGE 11479]